MMHVWSVPTDVEQVLETLPWPACEQTPALPSGVDWGQDLCPFLFVFWSLAYERPKQMSVLNASEMCLSWARSW